MRDLFKDQKGILSVSILFFTLIIFVILASLISIIGNNIVILSSNNDTNRAKYISESIIELKIAEITQISDKVIEEYLYDLKNYKIQYIRNIDAQPSLLYTPPNVSNYVTQRIIPEVKKLSRSESNPFEDYDIEHYYKIDIEYDAIQKVINITSLGRYNRSRRFIKAKLELPKVIDMGFDEYNLPKVRILSVNLVEYYQTIGL